MQIQKQLKKISKIKTVQLVTPSIWAWRKGRLKNIKKYTDLSASLFKFEHDFYKKHGLNNILLGHHFSELKPSITSDVLKKFNLDKDKKYISIMPGSRNSEIKNMMPTYLEFMKLYNDLNENTVKGWVQNAEGNYWGALTSSIATKISSSLAEQVTPTIQSGKPW